MLYLGNDCCASRFYEQLHLKFNHPFQWCRLDYDNFVFLIKNFKKVNFEKIKIKDNEETKVIIDDKVEINYVHYLYAPNLSLPTKIGADVFCSNPQEYIFEKYFKRLKRMNINDEASFVLNQLIRDDEYNITYENCLNFISLPAKNKILFLHNKEYYEELKRKKGNVKMVLLNTDVTGEIVSAFLNKFQVNF